MKPTRNCKYCDLEDECKRIDCARKLVFYANGDIKAVDPIEYNRYRIPEKKRQYYENRVTKVNF